MSSLVTASPFANPAILLRGVQTWAGPWLCFILPVSTLGFLLTGPHAWDAALLWTLPVWLCIVCDYFSPADRNVPKPNPREWLLDARLYLLSALQIANITLMLGVCSQLAWANLPDAATGVANLIAMRILVGTSSCCSGMAVAHELLHRRQKHLRWMGRLLLWTVGYDHFALEHAHGHHRMVATSADPATARYGETMDSFFKRSVAGQWANAWRLERQRLHYHTGFALIFRHRVLHGLILELGLLVLMVEYYGFIAVLMFIYQAIVAVRMLETVNYIQHWGLTRQGDKFPRVSAWNTDSWFTLHSFIGLSRHHDHHAHAGKPCYRLAHSAEGPSLPHGYFVMLIMIRCGNARYIKLASRLLKEKKRRQLQSGPM